MSSEQRKSTASTYATPAIIGVSALAIIGAGYYWYNSSSADSRVALLEATQAPASTSGARREEEAAAANESEPQQRQAATTAAKDSHSKAQQVQLPAEIERLPLNTSVSDLTEMLSKSASASQRLSQLALLAAQSAHKPLLQAHAASGALAAVLPLLRPSDSATSPAVRAAAWHALTNAASHPDMFDSIGVGDAASPGMLLRYAAEGLSAPPTSGAELQVHSRTLAVLQNLAQRDEGLAVLLAEPAALQGVGAALRAAGEALELPALERKKVVLGALKTLSNASSDAQGAEASARVASADVVAWLCCAASDASEVGGDAATAQVCPDTAERGIRVLGNWAARDAAWEHAAPSVERAGAAVPPALRQLAEQVPGEEHLQALAHTVLKRMGE